MIDYLYLRLSVAANEFLERLLTNHPSSFLHPMRKGFLLAADKKKRRAQSRHVGDSNGKRHDETLPRANGKAGLSMKQGFLLQSSPTRRKCKQQESLSDRKNLDGKDTTKATPPPQSVAMKKRDVTSTSAALLDLEDGETLNDDKDSSPSLINFIANSSNDHRDDEVSDSKQSPIMVEMDDGPITVIEEKTVDDVGRIDSANDDRVCSEENAAMPNNYTAAIEMDSFAFASEVSQLLSRLRRALKSNDQSKRTDVTNNSLIGVRQFMNQKSEKLIKAFVEKHTCIDASEEQELRLQQLWRITLQQIAQESPVSFSKKKKKRSTYSVSPQFALGIGILEFSKPIGVALESIATLLSSLASSIVEPNSCDEEKEKRHKIEAIGAILLVLCHFRCMNIETIEEETASNGFERIEASILLDIIIPALQSIVVNGQKRTYLSSTASDAFFELIEIIPRVQSIGFHSSIASPQVIWKDILPRIEEMIDVKRRWMAKSEGVTSSEIRVTPTLFCNAPFKLILPPILDYISHTCSSTSISCILCNVMEACAKEHADDFVGCLIISAQRHENCKLIFENNGENWKSMLLESGNDFAYRNILLATAKSMVDMPSSAVPLSLFSSLVGLTNDLDTTDSEQKILKATVSVVRFAVNELKLPRDFDSGDEQSVFKRFSPLLILRRLPKAYYQILHKHMLSTESSRTVMHELATELANEIRAHALKNDEGNLAREQKMLLAQVAGHCLPFSITPSDLNESPIALFDLFEKTFSATLDNMRFESKSSLDLQNIHESKLALFAVCQHISGASNDDVGGTAFVKVASFVFDFLYESQTTCGGEHIRQELAKLHTGCLHFLGVVFDSLFARKVKSSVEQNGPESNHCRNKFLDGLIRTFDDASSIVFNGAIPELQGRYFQASTRISIFNAMVTYAQNCTTEDQRLALFASELLPSLLKWVDEGAIDDDIRHPLCVAASLQVVYTILAKLGSFDWVNVSESKFVRLTLRCALKSLCNEERAGVYSPLRLVSMKVILTVIAIKQDLAEYFERDEIRRAVMVVRGAANRDESQEVRQLAFKILPYLEHTIHS